VTSDPAILPLAPDDLPALGRFLARGFGLPDDAEAVAPDVLRWKYLEPRPGVEGPRSLVAREAGGRIVGHLGLARTCWRLAGSDRRVSALHMLDWLADPGHKGIGARLMRRANTLAETQYGLGGTVIARKVAARAGYVPGEPVPVFRRAIRPSHRLRESGPWPGRLARAARDGVRRWLDRPERAAPATLRAVDRFGPEVEAALGRADGPLLFTDRAPEVLNAVLAYPRGGPRGYVVEISGREEGFAVLAVLGRGRVRVGKVVEAFLPGRDASAWLAADLALAAELARLGADVAIAFGPNPWEAEGLRRAGFRHAFDLDFHLRDRSGLLPAGVPRHLSFLEADYATIP
jgi:hypothetical protein